MSARTPFMPLSVQQKPSPTSFIPNQSNPLHRSSAQLTDPGPDAPLGIDVENAILPGIMAPPKAHRTASHGGNAPPKNIFQLAGANLGRPQTTAPSHHPSGPRQLNKSQNGHSGRIMTPKPVRISNEKPPILTSQDHLAFKTPALPPHVSPPRDRSPEVELLEPQGFSSNAHTSNDLHFQRRNVGTSMIRQQPSPDLSGGSEGDQINSFRTSTPYGGRRNGQLQHQDNDHAHMPEQNMISAQRVFPQNYSADDSAYGQIYAQQQQASANRKHSRDRYSTESDSSQQAKRPRNSSSTSGCSSMPVAATGDSRSFEQFAPPPPASPRLGILQELFGFDGERLLEGQREHLKNRIAIWQAAPEEEWEEGGKEIIGSMQKIVQKPLIVKVESYMDRKRKLVAMLDGRIQKHQDQLKDREQALRAVKDNLLSESQMVLGGKSSGP
ncbi:hypothetical protein NP233_g3391 [Leucocoprinus birnbaumii]|uniref:Extracellular mutant protein 11 C-terminal domain-containing protein n=1 Tax=Leucocoprinus birnbaumii TaxID=56174 RepID=A0AAD5VWN4_9AGAR|nr:hypothetical protein NP233_g3391 [Leucocoprinus birnbaumii]